MQMDPTDPAAARFAGHQSHSQDEISDGVEHLSLDASGLNRHSNTLHRFMLSDGQVASPLLTEVSEKVITTSFGAGLQNLCAHHQVGNLLESQDLNSMTIPHAIHAVDACDKRCTHTYPFSAFQKSMHAIQDDLAALGNMPDIGLHFSESIHVSGKHHATGCGNRCRHRPCPSPQKPWPPKHPHGLMLCSPKTTHMIPGN